MLKPAGEKLLDVLADVEVDDPTVPYVSNTTAELITSNDQVKELLGRQFILLYAGNNLLRR